MIGLTFVSVHVLKYENKKLIITKKVFKKMKCMKINYFYSVGKGIIKDRTPNNRRLEHNWIRRAKMNS